MVWSMEFMSDQLVDGRSFGPLNVLVDFNCEGHPHKTEGFPDRRSVSFANSLPASQSFGTGRLRKVEEAGALVNCKGR